MKKIVSDLIWSFDLVYKKNNPKILLVLQTLGICLFGYILFSVFFYNPLKVQERLVSNIDIIVLGVYAIIIFGGIFYNSKILGTKFFKDTAKTILIIFGRTILLIMIELILLFIIKLFGMIIFQISPITISEYNHFADVLWFYPLIQLPVYFFGYKKHYFSICDKKLS